MSGIQEAPMKSIRPYESSEQYLYAMKEDLAEWLNELYGLEINVASFLEILETGSVLCGHANHVTQVARDFSREYPSLVHKVQLPTGGVTCNESAQPGTFQARDNVSNFIQWCRKEMGIKVLMFETEDLVLRKNEKNFILCLLEVARRASRFGMSAPVLIQMEEEIEEEIREDMNLPPEETPLPRPQRQPRNFKNLDQMVQHLVSRCTCPVQFCMIKVSEGKYRVGNSHTLIFVRILRNHVMVRVGGGWDTLEHYLDKHDPCRCTSLSHKQSLKTTSLQRAQVTRVQHEITARPDDPSTPQPTLIVSRSQSPLPPVDWRTYTAHALGVRRNTLSPLPSDHSNRSKKPPGAQMSQDHSEPWRAPSARARRCSATPPPRLPAPEEKPTSKPSAPSRRETGHDPLPCRQNGSTNSSPSKALPKPAQGRETKTVQTAALQKAGKRVPSAPATQRNPSNQLPGSSHQELKYGSTPVRPCSPSKYNQASKSQLERPTGLREAATGSQGWWTKRPLSPVKQPSQVPKQDSGIKPGVTFCRPPTPRKAYQKELCFKDRDNPAANGLLPRESASFTAGPDTGRGKTGSLEISPGRFLESSRVRICRSDAGTQIKETRALSREGEAPKGPWTDSKGGHGSPKEKERVYTPLPIGRVEEQALYRSLEEEILSNIKELETESYGNLHPKENQVRDFRTDDSLRKDALPFGCNGPRWSTHALSCLPCAKKALSPGEAVPRSGVYVPACGPRWPPVGLPYDSVIQELSRTLRRDPVETERNSPQLSSLLVNGNQTDHVVLERIAIPEEKNAATEPKLNEPAHNTQEKHADIARNGDALEPEVTLGQDVCSTTSSPESSKPPQNRPRRSLKKPERVPSIYKLKLRPKIRPRRDHRPGKRPSKIPKPVAYRHAQRASGAKAQVKAHSSEGPAQNCLAHMRQNASGNGGCIEDFPQCSPSSSLSRDSGKKTVKPKGSTELTDDEESWV
ncbi:GAS2-like protein 2 isoform X2 [Paroedura picta]|uniref:GAS2-like protein 2 isoform X2 n=1 Tax=Paroedura picta TaxID=143630 RepID=UPI004055AAFF